MYVHRGAKEDRPIVLPPHLRHSLDDGDTKPTSQHENPCPIYNYPVVYVLFIYHGNLFKYIK